MLVYEEYFYPCEFRICWVSLLSVKASPGAGFGRLGGGDSLLEDLVEPAGLL